MKEREARGPYGREARKCSVVVRAAPLLGSGVDLKVRQQIVGQATSGCQALLAAYARVGTVRKASPLFSCALVFSCAPRPAMKCQRFASVCNAAALDGLVATLEAVSGQLPVLFAVHPRTRKKLHEFGLAARLERNARICITAPLGYIEFMNVVSSARDGSAKVSR